MTVPFAGPVGFVGLGAMGAPMARRMLASGRALVVTDVSQVKAVEWSDAGAQFVSSSAEVAEACRTTFLSLPGPREVETVVEELRGRAQPGDVIVDLSTNAYATVISLAERLARQGVAFLDAPVSGGVAGASKGRLAVMAGGDAEILAKVEPLLQHFAARVFHVGPTGMGTIAKLVNNQIFLAGAVVLQEGFVLAAKAGLEANQLLDIVKASSAGAYAGLAPLLLGRDFDNAIFALGLALKDLTLAVTSAQDLGVPMPTAEAALGVYRDAAMQGLGEKVFYATLQALERSAGVAVAKVEAAK